jgi:hypothetical protein
MHSDLIGKIEKARRYAQEPERIEISELKASVRGDNGTSHTVILHKGHWDCTCSFFRVWGTCAHVMAVQRLLDPMLTLRPAKQNCPLIFNVSQWPKTLLQSKRRL